MVHCIFDFVHGYLSNCKVQLFAGHKQCLHSSGVRELLSNDNGNSNSNKNGKENNRFILAKQEL